MDFENFIKDAVLSQEAYPVDADLCTIKLDANENPHPLPPDLGRAIFERLKAVSLNRYPSPGSPKLKTDFAGYFGVDEDMILIGNGSDELIHILNTAATPSRSGSVMFPTPTFAMYGISALNTGHDIIEIPLNDNFGLDIDAMLGAIHDKGPALVFLSYPNNPTGACFDKGDIEKILKASRGLVVLDEAYFNFSGKTFMSDLERWDNLVILRTLSKVGLAALRLGILTGHPALVHHLNKVRLPYNINIFSQVIGSLFVERSGEFLEMTDRITSDRVWLFNELTAIEGVNPYPSDANFILFSCIKERDDVYRRLIDSDILVKRFTSPVSLKNCMRVTVGTEEENRFFIETLKVIMQGE